MLKLPCGTAETWCDRSHYYMKSSPTSSEVTRHPIQWSQGFFSRRSWENRILCLKSLTRRTCFEARSLIFHRIVSLRPNRGKLINVMFCFVVWQVIASVSQLCSQLCFSLCRFKGACAWFVHFDMCFAAIKLHKIFKVLAVNLGHSLNFE